MYYSVLDREAGGGVILYSGRNSPTKAQAADELLSLLEFEEDECKDLSEEELVELIEGFGYEIIEHQEPYPEIEDVVIDEEV